jgi:radical SAM protein with 4Fe4S-binding SPASM domain
MQNLIVGSGLNPPRTLTLMITNKCNLKCLHCWPESGLAGDCNHVDRQKLLEVIHDFRMLGIKTICLTGGEPLLHPQWFDIVSFSCAEPGFSEVCLQTNATLLTRVSVRKLASFTHRNLIIQVSLEGSNSETHDKVRGSGSFKSALRGIALLAENGLAKQTRVSLTETEDNFQEIPALLNHLHSLGISQFASGTLVHGGRAAKENGNGLKPPTPLQYEMILHQFHSDLVFKEDYMKMANIAPLEWYLGKSTPSVSGCEFMKNPYVTAEGTLFPCVMFQIDKYAAHDVYSRPLAETLQAIIPMWADLQRQSRRRLNTLQTCRACPGRAHCRGGCMGRAYMAHGALMTTEDRCELRKVVYNWPSLRKQPVR